MDWRWYNSLMVAKDRGGRAEKRVRNNKIWPLLLLLAALGGLLLWSRAHSGAALQLVTVEYGGYTTSAEAQGLVVRGEHLLSASRAGYFIPTAEEGSKVAAGTAVGYMSETAQGASGETVSSGSYSGIISFQIDGWEEILNSEALASSDRSALVQAYEDGSVAANAALALESTAASRTVAKVVDNLDGYRMLLWLEAPPHSYVNQGQADLEYTTDAGETRALRVGVEENGMLADGRYYLLLNVPSTALELLYARHLSCRLLGASCSGVALPQAAVMFDEAGQASVWLVERNMLRQREVAITGQYGEYYYTNDVKAGARVATNTEKAREGWKLKP